MVFRGTNLTVTSPCGISTIQPSSDLLIDLQKAVAQRGRFSGLDTNP
jgi:hypothetical protein